ncbi:DNA helicase-2/ATP-dependent DNA helicase PcrA [Anseongella ginsenosidimutans]|uniref:DNA 3'-5' helicase n=1 Tax=Anseongella ginsenosidimutans TaxID=496056 RepID=A0A4R3KRG7_9SPHI|nr:UvrD-helicase domain-containing protein [Anseongella ginsenosidimutans]QEC52884.1 AAA family ATPase [Anseongella ginsenosidimutans]TCS87274.1 DNA helicase-2/ATP-dependent DNA helicase PcrA [Anseongella ginsenosidimutans]
MNYLELLNPSQRSAVESTEGPMMIVAGAGSGKTRVITYRIAHLLQKGVDAFRILALTFTNKAAKEMRERVTSVTGDEARNLWMGTFHSIFARILRSEAELIGYPANFTIYDTDDSKSLIKAILKELMLDDKLYNPNFVYSRISSAKNNLISAKEYMESSQIQADDISSGRERMGEIYQTYVKRCYKAGAMDFDDLLFKTNVLFRDHPEALHKYQHKFRYIMVDEYQDTNFSQYLIVKRLAAVHQNICVVGDDAQSIYAFRGANIQNILNFEKDYPDLKVFKLEQNYRSTKNIVNAANSIIANNRDQLEKVIFSENEAGEKIKVIRTHSDNEEGKTVAASIMAEQASRGMNYNDFAILYRTNAQSRAMEEALRKLNIPYKIYGGLSFYQRKEIRDLISYFRLTVNHNDEQALKRIINYPVRGIGKTSMDKLVLAADEQDKSLWEVVENSKQYIGGRSGEAIQNFAIMIKSFAAMLKNQHAYEVAHHIASQSGLLKDLYNDKSIEGLSRYENIQELLNGIKEFSEREDIEDKSLTQYLQDIALLTGDDKVEEKEGDSDTVSLMTIHAAKGLEFPHVYVVGMEENLFPSQLSLNSRTDLEEERRLFYVAATRAEKKLTLTYATTRYRWGSLIHCEQSRFIDEVDPKYLELDIGSPAAAPDNTFFDDERKAWNNSPGSAGAGERLSFSRPKPKANNTPAKPVPATKHVPTANFTADDPAAIREGMEVEHEKFGFGTIVKLEGRLPDSKATVLFKDAGQKQLLLKFAKLRIVKNNDPIL